MSCVDFHVWLKIALDSWFCEKVAGNVPQLHEVQGFVTAYFLIKIKVQCETVIPLNPCILCNCCCAIGKIITI